MAEGAPSSGIESAPRKKERRERTIDAGTTPTPRDPSTDPRILEVRRALADKVAVSPPRSPKPADVSAGERHGHEFNLFKIPVLGRVFGIIGFSFAHMWEGISRTAMAAAKGGGGGGGSGHAKEAKSHGHGGGGHH